MFSFLVNLSRVSPDVVCLRFQLLQTRSAKGIKCKTNFGEVSIKKLACAFQATAGTVGMTGSIELFDGGFEEAGEIF